MVQGFRWAFLVGVGLFLAGVAYQTYLAGVFILGTESSKDHIDVGWILHLAPVLILVLGAVGRVGARTLWWIAALVVSVGIQPFLPGLRTDLPWAAALHPVNALIIFWLTVTIGLRAWAIVREPTAA